MVKDYHMHPNLIRTSEERFDTFVRSALDRHLDEICITDHMPLSCSNAGDRIPQGKVKEYCEAVRAMAEKYRPLISIKLGIEIDYHESVRDEIEAVLASGDFDYIIGASHLHVIANGDIRKIAATRNGYVDATLRNTIEAAKTGYFDTIAHIDLFRWIFDNPVRFPFEDDGYCEERHMELIEETLDTIKSSGVRLEVNSHTAEPDSVTRAYPSVKILQLALEKGLKFSYGSDAHIPERVGYPLDALKAHPVYGKAIAQWENEG